MELIFLKNMVFLTTTIILVMYFYFLSRKKVKQLLNFLFMIKNNNCKRSLE